LFSATGTELNAGTGKPQSTGLRRTGILGQSLFSADPVLLSQVSEVTSAVLCPHCVSLVVQPLAALNQIARVDYYRCRDCGHVWTAPKAGQVGEHHDVTRWKASAPQKAT